MRDLFISAAAISWTFVMAHTGFVHIMTALSTIDTTLTQALAHIG